MAPFFTGFTRGIGGGGGAAGGGNGSLDGGGAGSVSKDVTYPSPTSVPFTIGLKGGYGNSNSGGGYGGSPGGGDGGNAGGGIQCELQFILIDKYLKCFQTNGSSKFG